jgi:hypothetical protein
MFQVRINLEPDKKYCLIKGTDCDCSFLLCAANSGESAFMCGLFTKALKEEGVYCLRDPKCLNAEQDNYGG